MKHMKKEKEKIKREVVFENQFVKLRIATEDPKENLKEMKEYLNNILIGDNPPKKSKKKKKDEEEPKPMPYVG